jgi:hypothetical protein
MSILMRVADKYLETLAESGKLISRTAADPKQLFKRAGGLNEHLVYGVGVSA